MEPIPDQLAFVAPFLVEIPKVTRGVYFLVKKGRVVYVGQTINGALRAASHLGKDYDRILFLPVGRDEYAIGGANSIEGAFIRKLDPPLNGTRRQVTRAALPGDIDLERWYGDDAEWAAEDDRLQAIEDAANAEMRRRHEARERARNPRPPQLPPREGVGPLGPRPERGTTHGPIRVELVLPSDGCVLCPSGSDQRQDGQA